jgi:glycosyltransferase involved in cell wall biosynthesis
MEMAFKKMKIALDVSPLQTGHKVRGVGFYLENLKKSLLKYHPENSYTFFERGEKLAKDIDVVHFPYFEPFFLARPIYRRYKTVVTVHDLTPIVFPEHFPKGIKGTIIWQMQRYALKQVDEIITDSNSSKKDIVKLIGVKENKVSVVHLAAGEQFANLRLSATSRQNFREKYNLPEKFVLYVGDVTWNKNLPRLIKAIKNLSVPLVMVGKVFTSTEYDRSNAWNKDRLEVELLTEADPSFIKLGFIPDEDLVAIYNLATLCIMPSLYEGFGLPILEAMACGCPVITSKEGSLPEVAGNGAHYIDAYSQESIEEGIKKVFFNKLIQEHLSKEGIERVHSFSWKKTAAQTLEVYERVVGIKKKA